MCTGLHHHSRAVEHLHRHLEDLVRDEVQSGRRLLEVVLACWGNLEEPQPLALQDGDSAVPGALALSALLLVDVTSQVRDIIW